MSEAPPVLEADYAITINARGRLSEGWSWTGWKRRHWPADIIRPGLLLYGFDLRPDQRKLTLLLRITRGGSFSFQSMEEYAKQVEGLTGRKPDPDLDRDKWSEIQKRVADGRDCTGICLCFDEVKTVSITLPGRCPRLGWIALRGSNFGME